MTFSDAVRTCLREKYATFSGRASRSEFWWFSLAMWLILMVAFLVLGGLFATLGSTAGGFGTGAMVLMALGAILYLALLIPFFSVTVRRFHDRNLSGWWYLGIFALSMVSNFAPENVALLVIAGLASIATLVICVLKGTQGPNKFGPDPLGSNAEEIFS